MTVSRRKGAWRGSHDPPHLERPKKEPAVEGFAADVPRALAPAHVPWFVPRPNWRFAALLAADILLVFVMLPLLSGRVLPAVAQLLTLLITACTIALVSDRHTVRFGILAALLLAAMSHALPGQAPRYTAEALAMSCAILVTIIVGRAVFSGGLVDAHRVAGGVAVYINLALAFAATYALISHFWPTAFSGLGPESAGHIEDMMHFSLTTLTTVGYGDIVPRSPLARSAADLEALIGQLYPATLLARLVGMQISRP